MTAAMLTMVDSSNLTSARRVLAGHGWPDSMMVTAVMPMMVDSIANSARVFRESGEMAMGSVDAVVVAMEVVMLIGSHFDNRDNLVDSESAHAAVAVFVSIDVVPA
jgi:hypothetical protein